MDSHPSLVLFITSPPNLAYHPSFLKSSHFCREKLEKLERRKILELSLDGGGVGHELEGEEGGDFQLHSSLREICMSDIVFFHGILALNC